MLPYWEHGLEKEINMDTGMRRLLVMTAVVLAGGVITWQIAQLVWPVMLFAIVAYGAAYLYYSGPR